MIKKLGPLRRDHKEEDWKKIQATLDKICNKRDQTIYASDSYHQRSLDQNAYFHGVIIPIIDEETGNYNQAYTKQEMAKKFATTTVVLGTGEEGELTQGTHEMNTKEMTEYIDKIRLWASEFLGCYIPLPDDPPDEILIQMSEKHGFKI
jgi:hypothetical protein